MGGDTILAAGYHSSVALMNQTWQKQADIESTGTPGGLVGHPLHRARGWDSTCPGCQTVGNGLSIKDGCLTNKNSGVYRKKCGVCQNKNVDFTSKDVEFAEVFPTMMYFLSDVINQHECGWTGKHMCLAVHHQQRIWAADSTSFRARVIQDVEFEEVRSSLENPMVF